MPEKIRLKRWGCLLITDVVKCGDGRSNLCMKRNKGAAQSMKPESDAASVRATITFPTDLYSTLEEIAKQKKVSLAWVVRDASEQYVAEKWPLFKGQG
jgi:hypothetical protein